MKLPLLIGAGLMLVGASTALAAPPSTATKTSTMRGIVVAKDKSQQALVVSTQAGMVRVIKAPTAFARTAVGRHVNVRYRPATGGLAVAVGVQRGGEARQALVRGTLIRVRRGHAVVSAGGSALTVSLRTSARQRALSSSGTGPKAGDDVQVGVKILADGSLGATSVTVVSAAAQGAPVASEGELVVRGTVTAVSPALVVKTGTGVVVACSIPAGAPPTGVAVGDRVELSCDLIGGQWTLRQAGGEHESDDDDDHASRDSRDLRVHGMLVSLDPLAVKRSSGEVVTCKVPAGTVLTGLVLGQPVELRCRTIDGVPTLERLKVGGSADDHEDDDDDSAEEDD
jgi:hypothetical protein